MTLTYDSPGSFADLDEATGGNLSNNDPPEVYEAVISLCHYFDCSVVLSRAEVNMGLVVCAGMNECCDVEAWSLVWPCFQLALQFDFDDVQTDCMIVLTRCSMQNRDHRAKWQAVRAQLDKDTLYRLVQMSFIAADHLKLRSVPL